MRELQLRDEALTPLFADTHRLTYFLGFLLKSCDLWDKRKVSKCVANSVWYNYRFVSPFFLLDVFCNVLEQAYIMHQKEGETLSWCWDSHRSHCANGLT